jgi:Fe-S cluster assembly iron-binding protein IscA
MISITPAAAAHLRTIIKHSRAQANTAVRLISNGKNGLSMTIGCAADGDTVLTDDVGPVLIIAHDIAGRLDGLVFDRFVDEVDGQTNVGLTFRKPTDTELLGLAAATPVAS